MNLAVRADAVQRALAKYRGSTLSWGSADCLHLARTVLVGIGAKGLPRIPNYSTELQAIRRLRERGHDTLEDLLATHCVEIPAARAMIGDLGILPGEGALSAIVVCAGNKWLGWPAPADGPHFGPLRTMPERVFTWEAGL